MITVNQAEEIILDHLGSFGIETIPFEQSLERVLAEDIGADRDFPPFDRVAMDGICIRYADFESGQRSFEIAGVQPAGSPSLQLNSGQAIEIMTGSMLSTDADTVIRYEDLRIESGVATIQIDDVEYGQNIHKQGSDRKKDSVILKKNTSINSAVIGVLTTVGKLLVDVYKAPNVTIVSTGDELVDVEDRPLPHQIRKSNVHTLRALLLRYGIVARLVHLKDDKAQLEKTLSEILTSNDVVLLSGAVSKGKFDFVPEIMERLGVRKLFHRVEQRPGKPFWFGIQGNTRVFAFPGNPVSTFVCAIRFFEPWLKKSLQLQPEFEMAILGEDVQFRPNLTYFLQVKLTNSNGTLIAQPIKGNGSGDLANLVNVDAFMELPPDRNTFLKGEGFRVWRF